MLVSPGPSKNTKSDNAEIEDDCKENVLAPIEEGGEEVQEVPTMMGRRRENPDRGGTGAATGDVGPHMGRKEENVEEGLGRGMAAEVEEGEGEEGRRAQAAAIPYTPSRAEREEHELTHIPYRSWCDHCVRARGRNRPHQRNKDKDDDSSKIPKISFD